MAIVGLHSTPAASGTRRKIGLKPKSSPMPSHTPRMVCWRKGRATYSFEASEFGLCCADIVHSIGQAVALFRARAVPNRKKLDLHRFTLWRGSPVRIIRHVWRPTVGNLHRVLQVRDRAAAFVFTRKGRAARRRRRGRG